MKTRSLILIMLIAGIPLSLLVWAATRIADNEQIVVRQQFRGLMEQRLTDVNTVVRRYFQATEARLQQLTALDDPDTVTLRSLGRTAPQVMQMFVLSDDGRLRYPDPSQPLNGTEKSFLLRAAGIFTDQHLTDAVRQSQLTRDTLATSSYEPTDLQVDGFVNPPANSDGTVPPSDGWFVWYWDRGLNLIYWQRRPSGQIIGVALDRSRWMADLIGELPDTGAAADRSVGSTGISSRIRLLNAASDVVYQWGQGTDDATESVCQIAVAAPLAPWRLECLVYPEQLPGTGRGIYFGMAGGLLAAGLAVALLAFVLVKDFTRDMHEASRQVSFVNQVSHELKTPLTNIRMYADLLEGDLQEIPDEDAAGPRRRLDVIQSEGRRLSRLIGNVLTFARQKRGSLQLTRTSDVPDNIVRQVLNHFQPALEELQIRIETNLEAGEPCRLDTDFLEQILGNLISNVEKYAADSGRLMVRSRLADGLLTIEVADDGPGIVARDRGRVFQPFVRLSRDISSAAGTGIGLSIARELARLHGGDVRLFDSSSGCHFEVTLSVE